MARRVRQHWTVGDVFVAPLTESNYGVGQVIAVEADALNSVTCALYREATSDPCVAQSVAANSTLISCVFVTRDLLDNGTWRVVCNSPVRVPGSALPFEHLRESGWVGAKIYGSGVVLNFLKAIQGLVPWDMYKDPHYFDKMLIAAHLRPDSIRLSGRGHE